MANEIGVGMVGYKFMGRAHSNAYRQAAASVLAPFSYVQLLFSTTLGWLIFAAVPDWGTLLGAAVIIGSGLYTVHRERVRARERAAARAGR